MARSSPLAAVAIATVAACGSDTEPPLHEPAATLVITTMVDPSEAPYFAAPWPDDRRLDERGYFDPSEFPNPRRGQLFENTLETGEGLLRGWGLSSPIYVPLTGPIDESSLPDPEASMSLSASIFLVALDEGAREPGPVPLEWHVYEEETLFLPGNVLAVRPVPGFPLAPDTRYALVVTTGVLDASGSAVEPEEQFYDAVWLDDETAAHYEHFAPLVAWLSEVGISRSEVAGAAVFTTQPLFDELIRIRDWLFEQARPELETLAYVDGGADYHLFEGAYEAPYFLYGEAPYDWEGGDMRFDDEGAPVPSEMESMRVAICVPRGEVPPDGFPVTYVSHGTGGDYLSMVRDDTCGLLGAQGIAAFGIDQILHGPRARGASSCLSVAAPEECFFSPVNAVAGRNLLRHTAVDHLSLRRMVEGLVVGESEDPEGRVVSFDTQRPGFFGHSQGALTGAVYLALEPEVRGALLSGGGGHLTTTILRRDEGAFQELLEGPFYLNIAGREELDPYHPALAFLQMFAEVTDPLSYGPHWHRFPIAGRKSVFKTSGLQDAHTPAATAVALAVAAGVPQMQGGHVSSPGFGLAGLEPAAPPVSGNVPAEGDHGEVTALLRQFPDGDHFVVFGDASVRAQASTFFETLVGDDTPRVPAP